MARSKWKGFWLNSKHFKHKIENKVIHVSNNFYENADKIIFLKNINYLNQENEFLKSFKYSLKFKWLIRRTRFIYKIYNRSLPITSLYQNFRFLVHKGNSFRKLIFSQLMVGHKFGEFAFTRKPFYYPIKDKKKNNRR